MMQFCVFRDDDIPLSRPKYTIYAMKPYCSRDLIRQVCSQNSHTYEVKLPCFRCVDMGVLRLV